MKTYFCTKSDKITVYSTATDEVIKNITLIENTYHCVKASKVTFYNVNTDEVVATVSLI